MSIETALTKAPECPSQRKRVAVVVGTRPEAVKLAPVVLRLQEAPWAAPVIVTTGQHGAVVTETLAHFGLRPHVDTMSERDGSTLAGLTSGLLKELGTALRQGSWEVVVVQGDTASTLAGATAAFMAGIPVVHIEAGLRSGDLSSPFPEEGHRRMVGTLASLHLAPTEQSCRNLRHEGVPDHHVLLTGNTVIDAAAEASQRPLSHDAQALLSPTGERTGPVVLVTAHRRENWGPGIRSISQAIAELSRRHPRAHFVVAAHMNPAVQSTMDTLLSGRPNVVLPGPVPYGLFVHVLSRCDLVITDSGGIQEEASVFGVPTLITRDTTERVEGVRDGIAQLVGTDPAAIVVAAEDELATARTNAADTTARKSHHDRVRTNPYGDGHAAQRCAQACGWLLGAASRPHSFRPPRHAAAPTAG